MFNVFRENLAVNISADHHFEYPRADFIRVRLNNFELNGGILKAIGLKLAKRDRVKVGL